MRLPPVPLVITLVLSALVLSGAIAASLGMRTVEASARTATLEARSRTDQIARWQREAPLIYAGEARARKAIGALCWRGRDLNGVFLDIAHRLNTGHVSATMTDLLARYPTPSPAPVPSGDAKLGTTLASAAPATAPPVPTLAGGRPAYSEAQIVNDLVRVEKTASLFGRYPDVIAALAMLATTDVPVEISGPQFERNGGDRVRAGTTIAIDLPPPDICNVPELPQHLGGNS